MNPLITVLPDLVRKAIDKWGPASQMDEKDKLELESQVRLAVMSDENKKLETAMSAILEEAKSKDPWTSRARPSFLYVMYAMILASIPMGVLSAFDPEMAEQVANGMKAWLGAIPDGLWATFGVGYSGYAIARSVDKKQIKQSFMQ